MREDIQRTIVALASFGAFIVIVYTLTILIFGKP